MWADVALNTCQFNYRLPVIVCALSAICSTFCITAPTLYSTVIIFPAATIHRTLSVVITTHSLTPSLEARLLLSQRRWPHGTAPLDRCSP